MKERFFLNLNKSERTEDVEGVLTTYGMEVAQRYASSWRDGNRQSELEEAHPELIGLFYDIRNDEALAKEHAIPLNKSSNHIDRFVIPLAKAMQAVIAIGKHGGKIVGYNKGKPVYQKETKDKPKAKAKQPKAEGRRWVDHVRDPKYQTIKEFRIQPPPEDAPPKYRKKREALHTKIKDSFLKDSKGKPIPPPAKHENKIAYVMMGGPASGKTSLVKGTLGVPKGQDIGDYGFVNINPDDIKEKLPEWDEGLSKSAKDTAWVTHEESSDVAGDVFHQALTNGNHIVVDGTGKTADKHIRKIGMLRDHGYEVRLLMPDVDMDEAAKRANSRADRSGRYVPIDRILKPAHRKIPGNFETIAREADSFMLFDMNVPMGDPPVLKWSGGKDKEDVLHDPEWVEGFKDRGQKLQAVQKRLDDQRREGKMGKSVSDQPTLRKATPKGTAKVDVLPFEKVLGNLAKVAPSYKGEDEGPTKYPNARRGEGIEMVIEDPEYYPDRPITYE